MVRVRVLGLVLEGAKGLMWYPAFHIDYMSRSSRQQTGAHWCQSPNARVRPMRTGDDN
jgi:hypothetical protein